MSFDPSHYDVTEYEHIDDFRCFKPLAQVFQEDDLDPEDARLHAEKVATLRAGLSELFADAGWEGDGEINCIFIAPPFSSRGWTNCEIVFHVKQVNNGISFLAIPKGFKSVHPEYL